jgi:hypothetical protein
MGTWEVYWAGGGRALLCFRMSPETNRQVHPIESLPSCSHAPLAFPFCSPAVRTAGPTVRKAGPGPAAAEREAARAAAAAKKAAAAAARAAVEEQRMREREAAEAERAALAGK